MRPAVLAIVALVAGCSAAWVPDWLRDPDHAVQCSSYCPGSMACAGGVCETPGMRAVDAGR